MKTLKYILSGLMIVAGLTVNAQLAPDQNPNYMRSAEKYAEKSDELTANQGETIQQTYKAYDWREFKAEQKQQRIDRRYELRKLKIENRNRCCRQGCNRSNRPYYNNGYGYYNNGCGGYYNNACNCNPYTGYNYSPNYNGLLYGAGLGLGLYYLLN